MGSLTLSGALVVLTKGAREVFRATRRHCSCIDLVRFLLIYKTLSISPGMQFGRGSIAYKHTLKVIQNRINTLAPHSQ